MDNYFYSITDDGYGIFYHTGDMWAEVKSEELAKGSVDYLNRVNDGDSEVKFLKMLNEMKNKAL